mmetsp:Transcript_16148/g.50761  ORF Transcript_16148/g.50761 Transcript_16148/m.50761 type:complete len:215 (-) Transcript_16148:162-806(-)
MLPRHVPAPQAVVLVAQELVAEQVGDTLLESLRGWDAAPLDERINEDARVVGVPALVQKEALAAGDAAGVLRRPPHGLLGRVDEALGSEADLDPAVRNQLLAVPPGHHGHRHRHVVAHNVRAVLLVLVAEELAPEVNHDVAQGELPILVVLNRAHERHPREYRGGLRELRVHLLRHGRPFHRFRPAPSRLLFSSEVHLAMNIWSPDGGKGGRGG